MNSYTVSVASCGFLFVAMLAFAAIGHWSGRRRLRIDPEAKEVSTGTVDAAVLSLLGLLVAFTFSSAYSRYETRRELIVQEANAIGTAHMRLDLLKPEAQSKLRREFRDYLDSRIELWRKLPDRDAAIAEYARSQELQGRIWSDSIAATSAPSEHTARMLLVPALNEMIDITTTRFVAVQSHPPLIIFILLGGLAVASAWLAGFAMAKTARLSRTHVVGFAAIASVALCVILDIEYPRFGFVRLDAPHELLVELRERMQ
jgi:hypothetical protein